MPPTRAKKALKSERVLRQQAEMDNLVLRQQLESQQGIKAPLPWSISATWDWLCPCGNQVYAGRRHCPLCQTPRHQGCTMTGFVRGVMQSNPGALKAQIRQREVPGYVTRVSHASKSPLSSLNPEAIVCGGYASTLQPRPATWADVARRANDVGRSGNQHKDARPNSAPIVSAPTEAATAADRVLQEEDDQDIADAPVNPSIPEDMDYDSVKKLLFDTIGRWSGESRGTVTRCQPSKLKNSWWTSTLLP